MQSNLLLSMEIVGSRDASGQFQSMGEALASLQRARLRAAAQKSLEAIKLEAPRSKGEGPHLADGLRVRTYESGPGAFNARVTAGGPHGWLLPLILEGTRAHPIYPKKAGGLLRFQWDKGPRGPGIYFFRKVNHPGTRPNDFPIRGFARVRSEVDRDLRSIAAQAIIGVTQ